MPRMSLVLLLVLSSVARADQGDLVATQLTALRTAATCSTKDSDKPSPFRPWCIATDFAKGTSAPLPRGKILVGLTIELQTDKDAADELIHGVTFAALAVDKDGKLKLTDVKSTSEEDLKALGEAVFNVAAVFKGKAATAKLPKELADYAKTLKGAYTATKAGAEWTWQGASTARMRKVGAFWVIVETPKAANGIFATILTDKWQ
jgi:hypothetical protein